MPKTASVTNIVLAGIGGQGVLKASDIVSDAAFRTGLDVKKSEIHGMSQRGGSVTSDVRFGERVLSPMVPANSADFLVVVSADQVENNRHHLRAGGVLITPGLIDETKLAGKRTLNVALLGILSTYLEIPESEWLAAIESNLPEPLREANRKAFAIGRLTRSK
jgi:indolepyruvate ferredoxin oxidoreductase, beta subunit